VEAERLAEDANADVMERARACKALNFGRFFHFEVLSHDCTCLEFLIYSACNQPFAVDYYETPSESSPPHVDPRALGTRRRGGRPRGAGRALQILPPVQEPRMSHPVSVFDRACIGQA
jgi:hypothetical protein